MVAGTSRAGAVPWLISALGTICSMCSMAPQAQQAAGVHPPKAPLQRGVRPCGVGGERRLSPLIRVTEVYEHRGHPGGLVQQRVVVRAVLLALDVPQHLGAGRVVVCE
jgi:hypothetical protein